MNRRPLTMKKGHFGLKKDPGRFGAPASNSGCFRLSHRRRAMRSVGCPAYWLCLVWASFRKANRSRSTRTQGLPGRGSDSGDRWPPLLFTALWEIKHELGLFAVYVLCHRTHRKVRSDLRIHHRHWPIAVQQACRLLAHTQRGAHSGVVGRAG